ncbi:MAG: c-type cytochrome [Bacteroidetes bacterium]|nr:c-type cytochrome [Bacteroidota bacterium]
MATIFTPSFLIAQGELANTTAATSGGSWDMNSTLIAIAFILLLPLFLLANTYLSMVKWNIGQKSKDLGKGIGTFLLLFSFSQIANAQVAANTAPASSTSFITYCIISIIVLEILIMVYFLGQINKLLNIAKPKTESSKEVAKESWLALQWRKANNFKALDEEDTIDTGHNYDGIRELDNITPPWFKFGFLASILFAIVYLYVYHISKSAPLQIEEFNAEMEQAEIEKAAMLSKEGNSVDENTVVMLGSSEIAKGRAVFGAYCSSCHGPNGQSMKGGVGPNLTDDYWIHGGDIKDIFKIIKYGWQEKGMIAWENQFSPNQIAEIASYINSIKGTNVAGGKEPQGDKYAEQAPAGNTSKDSLNIKE